MAIKNFVKVIAGVCLFTVILVLSTSHVLASDDEKKGASGGLLDDPALPEISSLNLEASKGKALKGKPKKLVKPVSDDTAGDSDVISDGEDGSIDLSKVSSDSEEISDGEDGSIDLSKVSSDDDEDVKKPEADK